MESIMTRHEMFETITDCNNISNLSEYELKLRQDYFKELIKPITVECKRFVDDYLKYFKQHNVLLESDKDVFTDRILHLIFNEVRHEFELT